MDQEKIGNLIKKLRKNKNMTQKEFANKLGVTYQAVSKWENGKNMPDISTLRLISKEFDVDINEILDGNIKKNKSIIILPIIIIIILFIVVILIYNDNNYNFKTLTTNCNDFKISGSIAYNKDKSTIYISDIEYCGSSNNNIYTHIESTLYESKDNIDKKISNHTIDNETTTLEDYLKTLSFYIDNYSSACKIYKKSKLYIELHATTEDNITINYKIPLNLEEKNCNN